MKTCLLHQLSVVNGYHKFLTLSNRLSSVNNQLQVVVANLKLGVASPSGHLARIHHNQSQGCNKWRRLTYKKSTIESKENRYATQCRTADFSK